MKRLAIAELALDSVGTLLAACALLAGDVGASADQPTTRTASPADEVLGSDGEGEPAQTAPSPDRSQAERQSDGEQRTSGQPVGRLPAGDAVLTIDKVGNFTFDAASVKAVQPDVFQPGHYSLFDVLVHVGNTGQIALDYHFDESADTHVIDAINGAAGWWHQAFYDAGWPEPSVFRMDQYPYWLNSVIRIVRRKDSFLDEARKAFQQEVERLAANGGQVIIPRSRDIQSR